MDAYGIPFSVIPFKGRPVKKPESDDRPKHHVRAVPERGKLEIRFPVVEGYAFALHQLCPRVLFSCAHFSFNGKPQEAPENSIGELG